MIRRLRNLSFLVLLAVTVVAQTSPALCFDCEEEIEGYVDPYCDGYNFGGGYFSSSGSNHAACQDYCGSGNVSHSDWSSFGNCPARGYCQCLDWIC